MLDLADLVGDPGELSDAECRQIVAGVVKARRAEE